MLSIDAPIKLYEYRHLQKLAFNWTMTYRYFQIIFLSARLASASASTAIVRFYSCSDRILVGIFTTFNVCGCSDTQKIWICQNFDQKIRIWIFYGRFLKKRPFFWVRNDLRAGLVCSFSKQSHSWPKKMAVFHEIGHKKIKLLFFGQFWHVQILWVSEHQPCNEMSQILQSWAELSHYELEWEMPSNIIIYKGWYKAQ